jgi:hypothetical protein
MQEQSKINQRQLVDAATLLETLFDKRSRPSLRWLRQQQRDGRIPSTKCGRLIFFEPEQVRAAMFPSVAK